MKRTAEFVSPKHPDKICDRISDKILDYCLTIDKDCRVAVETMGGHGFININGEITINTDNELPINDLVKEVVGDDYRIQVKIVQQSPEIAQGVDTGGAGDQGIMVGYACRENDEYVPQEYYLARSLCKHIYKIFDYDGKTQITIDENHNIVAIVCSFQNASSGQLRYLITQWLEKQDLNIDDMEVFCNPAGDWTQGGFDADAGLTGRKLVVDNYGPRVPIGGGAYSGKDPSKVDRSAAYMARYIALDQMRTGGVGDEVTCQLSYGIGIKKPIQAIVQSKLGEWDVSQDYDLSPQGIIELLDLKKPIYYKTSKWGAYGNKFNWDK
mgnify:CR=1 FL=1|tara:strand:+ start:181 stop:1155 length:975 start_codon:yes stop_codon:yes gene_type:complete